ncbi:MAG: HAD-IC family P-type ATPase, partial [[Eubacterium] sulci]|nr:HAD-IC family P-type ATPase [[Eubacterium] sulci]
MGKEYLHDPRKVLEDLNTGESGLTSEEVARRQAQYGANKLAEGNKKTKLQRFLEQLKDPMLIMLIIAAGVSAVTNIISGESMVEVFIIIVVVLINAILGVLQESKAEEAIVALQTMTAATCKVIRDGKQQVIPSAELVPGDIVVLEAGDAVPADGRLISAASLKIEESALTGESVPVNKLIDILNLGDGKDVPLG